MKPLQKKFSTRLTPRSLKVPSVRPLIRNEFRQLPSEAVEMGKQTDLEPCVSGQGHGFEGSVQEVTSMTSGSQGKRPLVSRGKTQLASILTC